MQPVKSSVSFIHELHGQSAWLDENVASQAVSLQKACRAPVLPEQPQAAVGVVPFRGFELKNGQIP